MAVAHTAAEKTRDAKKAVALVVVTKELEQRMVGVRPAKALVALAAQARQPRHPIVVADQAERPQARQSALRHVVWRGDPERDSSQREFFARAEWCLKPLRHGVPLSCGPCK